MTNQSAIIVNNNPKIVWIIAIVSGLIPLVVALLLAIPQTGKLGDLDLSFLAPLNAGLNSCTAISLVLGLVQIKKGNRIGHRNFMISAFVLSSLFLVSYVLYHFQEASTKFGDSDGNGIVSEQELAAVGSLRFIYFFILLTHIILATIIVPLVLFTIWFAYSEQFVKHKKWAKYTFPIWLYVAVSGVVVYFMISPYYHH